MKKQVLVASLTALTMLSGISASAQGVFSTRGSDELIQTNNTGKRVKRDVLFGPENKSVSAKSTYKENVDIAPGYGHGKFYVHNSGKADITLTFERTSDLKQTTLEGHIGDSTGVTRISAGESRTIYTEKPTGGGEHRIQLNSSNAPLNATVTYKYSNNKTQLQ